MAAYRVVVDWDRPVSWRIGKDGKKIPVLRSVQEYPNQPAALKAADKMEKLLGHTVPGRPVVKRVLTQTADRKGTRQRKVMTAAGETNWGWVKGFGN